MVDRPGSGLHNAQLDAATSRLRIVLYAVIAAFVLSLVGGIATGNYQPLAVLVVMVGAVVASWLWSVFVDRSFHRFREWNRSHTPQPLTAERPRKARAAMKLPLRIVTSGPASVSVAHMVELGHIPLAHADEQSEHASERIAALKMRAGEVLGRLADELERDGLAEEAQKVRADLAAYDPLADSAPKTASPGADERAGSDLARALGLLRGKDFEQARSALETLADRSKSGAVLYGLAVCSASAGDAGEAADAFRRAAEAGAETAAARMAMGIALAEQGQYEDASRQLRAAVTMDPDLAPAHAALAEVQTVLGDIEAARDSVEKALALDPDMPLARAAFGRVLYQLGDAAGACRELANALESDPGNSDLLYNHAAALAACERYDEIIARIAPAVDDSRDPQTAQIVAEAYERRGQAEKARQYMAMTVELLPDSEAARVKLVRSLRLDGKLAEAREQAEALTRESPRSAAGLAELGQIAEAEGNTDQALTHYRSAIQMDRTSAVALTHAGRILAVREQYKEALGMLKQAAALPGATDETMYWLGETHLRSGKALLAIDSLRDASRLAESPRGDVSYALGRALLHAGRAKDAVDELRKARKLLPDVPEISRELGYAFHKSRNYQEAVRSLKQYLQAVPDASDASDVRALADELARG